LQVASIATSSCSHRLSEEPQRFGRCLHPAAGTHQALLPDRDLGELAMYVESDTASHAPPSNQLLRWETRRANDTYGFALAADPG